jgi:hypothetical protein
MKYSVTEFFKIKKKNMHIGKAFGNGVDSY